MSTFHFLACTSLLLASTAWAERVTSFAQLEDILDDQIVIEDFEGISLHGGSIIDVPNPLNSVTIEQLPWSWAIEPGVTYESPTQLQMHAGFSGGNENVYLRVHDSAELRFDTAQVAVGFSLLSSTTGQAYTISVYDRVDALIEELTIPPTLGGFFGYESATRGISRMTISHSQLDFFSLDDVAFGLDFIACPGDMNGDLNHDVFDVFAFLDYFNDEDDRADFTDDGQFDIFDVFLFIDAMAVACP